MKEYLKLIGIILLILYFMVANYCKFKDGLGFDVKNCSCRLK